MQHHVEARCDPRRLLYIEANDGFKDLREKLEGRSLIVVRILNVSLHVRDAAVSVMGFSLIEFHAGSSGASVENGQKGIPRTRSVNNVKLRVD